ncbi:MAG: hypothetical protein PHO46_00835 [Thermoguttaceae bacterium]|nr:hypothetical protein [Thermoguttaceae bacterium]
MKNLRFLSTLIVGTFIVVGVSAFGKEPVWIFNNGDGAPKANVGQGIIYDELGLTTIVSTGLDCTLTPVMAKEDAFKASERPFFAVRYKYETDIDSAGLFFTNDEELKSLSDKSYSMFGVEPDGTWHNKIVDMRTFSHGNWKGTITSFRFDPTNPSALDAKYSISRLGFFPTAEAAQAFLDAANDEPDYSQTTILAGDNHRCLIPGGVLDSPFQRSDFLIGQPAVPTEFKLKNMREDVVVERDGKVEALCDVTSRGFALYCASKKGVYSLNDLGDKASPADVVGRKSEPAVRFVLARRLMSAEDGKFRPEKILTQKEIDAAAKALAAYANYGDIGATVAAGAKELNGMTREEAATFIMERIRAALGVNIDASYPAEYFTRERLRVGAWGNFRPSDFDEEYMRVYADCGFDFLLAMGGIPTKDLLSTADKYGVEVYVNDGGYNKPLAGDAEYIDHPSYTGAYVIDEPGSDDFEKIAAKCNPYKEATGKEPYVNLLPMYANAAQLKYGAGAAAIEYYDKDPDLFRKYCVDFCEKFDTYYICTDIYPLNWDADHKKTTYPDYVESINVIASVAREYDREFWCYIQTFAWVPSKRTPTEAEYRWQCYSMLSFGCRCILCWTYAGYKDDFPSLVDTQSRQTTAWYDARPVFWELRRLSDEYVKYRNIGAFTHNCTDATPYLKMTGEYKDFAAIEEIDCTEPLLVGCFEKKDETKSGAFTLVNMSELQDNKGATVRMKLAAESAVAWYRGTPQTIKPNAEGYFSFELASGEGVFVTLP